MKIYVREGIIIIDGEGVEKIKTLKLDRSLKPYEMKIENFRIGELIYDKNLDVTRE